MDREPAEFITLPNEIVTLIAGNVERCVMSNFRLTCKHVNAIATPIFGKAFFETRYVTLSLQCLIDLVNISENATFAPFVRRVALGTTRFIPQGISQFSRALRREAMERSEFVENLERLQNQGTPPPNVAAIIKQRLLQMSSFRRNVAEQGILLYSAHCSGETLLATAFANFRRFGGIISLDTYNDLPEPHWWQRGPHIGAQGFYAGLNLESGPDDLSVILRRHQDVHDSIATLLAAAHKAGCGINDVTVRLSRRPYHVDIYDTPELRQALASINSLSFEPCQDADQKLGPNLSCYAYLLTNASSIERLRINLKHIGNEPQVNLIQPCEWLSQHLSTTCLQEVIFTAMHFSARDIVQFLAKHKATLRSVIIDVCHLDILSDWVTVCDWINDNLQLERVKIDTTLSVHMQQCPGYLHDEQRAFEMETVEQTTMPLDGRALLGPRLVEKATKNDTEASVTGAGEAGREIGEETAQEPSAGTIVETAEEITEQTAEDHGTEIASTEEINGGFVEAATEDNDIDTTTGDSDGSFGSFSLGEESEAVE